MVIKTKHNIKFPLKTNGIPAPLSEFIPFTIKNKNYLLNCLNINSNHFEDYINHQNHLNEKDLTFFRKLKNENIKVLAIEQVENSTKLNTFFPEKNQKYAIVMGNEVKGVQEAVVNAADLCIEIPQLGTKHSLNISVTTGIVLWDLFQKLNS